MQPRGIMQIVAEIGGRLEGAAAGGSVRGVAPPAEAAGDQLTLYVDRRQRRALEATSALAVLTDEEHASEAIAAGRTAWIHADPLSALACLLDRLYPEPPAEPPVLDTATGSWAARSAVICTGAALAPGCVVHASARIGPGSRLMEHAVVGRGAVLGRECLVGAGAWIGPTTRLGDRVEIGPGAVVGADGFGLRSSDGRWSPVRHVGRVELGDDVSIGARSVVARGTLGTTSIGTGTRIDAHVQIGHNVRIGRDCAIAAQAGIAGSTVIGDRVMIGGQAGIADHLHVGEGARIAARSGVAGDVEAGATVEGYPAVDRWAWLRMMALLKKQATDDD